MGKNWYGEIVCQHLHAFHMVNMVVCDQYGFDVGWRQVVLGQTFHNLLCRNAHINQNALILLTHIIAIAATTRGKAAKDKGGKAGKEIHTERFWAQK